MLDFCLPRKTCKFPVMKSNRMAVAIGLIVAMTLAMVPAHSYAKSFWDKVKDAAKKSQQQQQQNSQQQNTAQQRQAAAPNSTKIKSFDVLGISLGMDKDKVEKLLRKKYPDYHVIPINYTAFGQKWTGMIAAMPKTKHKNEVVYVDFALPPLKRKVIAITRYKEYPSNATPSLKNVEKGLTNKYGAWTKGEATTRAGYRKIYEWWMNQSPRSCVNEKLHTTFGRLREVIEEGSLSRVLGDTYGDPTQFIKPFRDYATINAQTASCGKQVTAEVIYRPDLSFSPVNKLITVVADFSAYFNSEVAFSKIGKAYNQRKAAGAMQKGGIPDL